MDKVIFGYGYGGPGFVSMTNLVSNTGVVSNDVTGVGTARYILAAVGFGGDKAIFGYGVGTGNYNTGNKLNKVSNIGIVAAELTGVGTGRGGLATVSYGT